MANPHPLSTQMHELDLSDPDTEDLFASPPPPHKPSRSISEAPQTPASSSSRTHARNDKRGEPDYEDGEEAREEVLRRELEGLRNINRVVEGVVESLERARGNMDSVSLTVSNASSLLQTWTRILSQTEHNQRLILNPSWQGASQDISDMENETLLKEQEKERRELEDAQRREAAARKAEEEERRKSEAAIVKGNSTGARGRGRGRYGGVGGQGGGRGIGRGGATPGRSTSGIGRGGGGRGRGRGLS